MSAPTDLSQQLNYGVQVEPLADILENQYREETILSPPEKKEIKPSPTEDTSYVEAKSDEGDAEGPSPSEVKVNSPEDELAIIPEIKTSE